MINPEELDKEILMLEKKDTTYANCERLAWLYIVRDHVTGQQQRQPAPLDVSGDSDFLCAIDGKDSVLVWALMDELMDALKVLQPKLYSSVMNKLA